jgi:hypothetical protein
MVDTGLWGAVDSRLLALDVCGADQMLDSLLCEQPGSRFKGLVGRHFTNQPSSVLGTINGFIRTCGDDFEIKAVYLEMNGFDINWDRWYFDCFGYSQYVDDPVDTDWLCDWQSGEWPQVTLTGLEAVQADFEWYHTQEVWRDEAVEPLYEVATLSVMVKFVQLIQEALRSGALVRPVPVLATAHEFDMFGRFTN